MALCMCIAKVLARPSQIRRDATWIAEAARSQIDFVGIGSFFNLFEAKQFAIVSNYGETYGGALGCRVAVYGGCVVVDATSFVASGVLQSYEAGIELTG